MTVSGGFTQTIDWLAFTLPKAEVADVTTMKSLGSGLAIKHLSTRS
jgi:hypothetical protein